MNRRGFLQALAAGTYSLALPAFPALGEASRDWGFHIHDVEILPTGAFGSTIRGAATLTDRPEMSCYWQGLVDLERLTEQEAVDMAVEDVRPRIAFHFRRQLEAVGVRDA